MLSLCALCCLPSVKSETNFHFFFNQCIIKQKFIRFGFRDVQKHPGLGKGYQLKPKAEANTGNPYLDVDYSVYHKNLIQ